MTASSLRRLMSPLSQKQTDIVLVYFWVPDGGGGVEELIYETMKKCPNNIRDNKHRKEIDSRGNPRALNCQ